MTDPSDDDGQTDAELMRLVLSAFEEGDPVPESATQRATRLLSWRADGADIAFIVDDADDLMPVRDTEAAAGAKRFRSEHHRIDITISPVSIVGSIEPWTAGRATVEFEDGSVPVEVDEHGEFQVEPPTASPVRLRFDTSDREVVTTNWFPITRGRSS